jgi:hypothetical protein
MAFDKTTSCLPRPGEERVSRRKRGNANSHAEQDFVEQVVDWEKISMSIQNVARSHAEGAGDGLGNALSGGHQLFGDCDRAMAFAVASMRVDTCVSDIGGIGIGEGWNGNSVAELVNTDRGHTAGDSR